MVRAAALGVIVVAAGLMSSPAAAQQQQQGGFFDFFSNLMKGTPEEEAACRPDVEKYCHDAEPDTFRVLGLSEGSAQANKQEMPRCAGKSRTVGSGTRDWNSSSALGAPVAPVQ